MFWLGSNEFDNTVSNTVSNFTSHQIHECLQSKHMIPINRKPKLLNKKVSTPSPGLRGNLNLHNSEKVEEKSDFLRRYQEVNNPSEDNDIFGTIEGGINFDDDFRTLRIGDFEPTTIQQGIALDEEIDDFEQQLGIQGITNLASPMDSVSTSSPKLSLLTSNRFAENSRKRVTRKTLSEYSEGDDTDVTSQINEDDFDDLDNIFGAEESGIYDKINQKLKAKQKKLEHDAELEEVELKNKYNKQQSQQPHDITLKIKDFNQFLSSNDIEHTNNHNTLANLSYLDQIENKTINYEYTRDDFESFEDGFDKNFESKLQEKGTIRGGMKCKSSMPNMKRNQASSIKKHKSTMDIHLNRRNHNLMEDENEDEFDPGFNYNNKVIRKLDRIPSFYNSNTRTNLANDTSRKKQQLLNKYSEQTRKENQHRKKILHNSEEASLRMGTVKYLNTNSVIQNPNIPTKTKNMTYNAASKRWEGNDVDLLRFENMHRPSLITLRDLQDPLNARGTINTTLGRITQKVETSEHASHDKDNRNPNMVYDNENLRWINLNDETDSVFNEIPDLVDPSNPRNDDYQLSSPPSFMPPRATFAGIPPSHPKLQSPINHRGLSQFTQRTVSSNTNSSSNSNDHNLSDEFNLSLKMMEKFYKEQEKIHKKTMHWFTANETYNSNQTMNRDYYWEIRKMVIDNE